MLCMADVNSSVFIWAKAHPEIALARAEADLVKAFERVQKMKKVNSWT